MIFAFLSPYIARIISDGCRKIFFLIFAGLGRRHANVPKHIILKTKIYEIIKKHHK